MCYQTPKIKLLGQKYLGGLLGTRLPKVLLMINLTIHRLKLTLNTFRYIRCNDCIRIDQIFKRWGNSLAPLVRVLHACMEV